jgi:hypothetical protein
MTAVFNLIIMGAGRSGTSLVAGALAHGPWHMGDNYIAPRSSNPKGFFEDSRVNTTNEDILARLLPYRLNLSDLRRNQRWLAKLPTFVKPTASAAIRRAIADLTSRTPFCYKDPRFCYTLSVWRAVMPAAKTIVVFRHPSQTAASIVKECETADYLSNVRMTFKRALDIWLAQYKAVLHHHASGGEWLFVAYEDLLTEPGMERLESFTGAKTDRRFPEPGLHRSKSLTPIPTEHASIFGKLSKLASQ